MRESLTYQQAAAPARDQAHTLFAQTTGYVAATAGLFALGAYLDRHLAGGAGIVAFLASFACMIGMQFPRPQVAAADGRAAGRLRPADRAGGGPGAGRLRQHGPAGAVLTMPPTPHPSGPALAAS
jgi:hypothetical protein